MSVDHTGLVDPVSTGNIDFYDTSEHQGTADTSPPPETDASQHEAPAESPRVDDSPEDEPQYADLPDAPQAEPDTPADAPADAQAEQTVPEFSPQLLADAGGLTQQEALDRYKSPENLQIALEHFDRQMLQYDPAMDHRLQQQATAPKQELPPSQLPPEMDDEETRTLVKFIQDQQAPQFKQQTDLLSSLIQERQQERLQLANERYKLEFEKAIDDLGEEWEPVFGKGDGDALDPNGPHIQNRLALDVQIKRMHDNRTGRKQPGLTISDRIRRVAPLSFPNHHTANIAKAEKEKLTARQSQFSNPPTRVSPTGKTPEERAVAVANKQLRKMGIRVQEDAVGSMRGEEV